MVYFTTPVFVAERFTNESMIFPVPLGEFPVTLPDVTEEIHEKVLPVIAATGVKLSVWFEHIVWVLLVPTLSG